MKNQIDTSDTMNRLSRVFDEFASRMKESSERLAATMDRITADTQRAAGAMPGLPDLRLPAFKLPEVASLGFRFPEIKPGEEVRLRYVPAAVEPVNVVIVRRIRPERNIDARRN